MSVQIGNGWELVNENGPQIELMKGWKLELLPDGKFQIVNRDDKGKRKFYSIEAGPYSPVIIEDPENSFSLGTNDYVDGKGAPAAPAMKVKGIIGKSAPGSNGSVTYRGNLTNFFSKDGGSIEEDGKLAVINGVRHRLYRLVAENKNRLVGYIGFYIPEAEHDGSPVQISEIEDLA